MKLKDILFTGFLGMAALGSCSKEEIDTFSGGAQVYFERVAGSGTADSLTYSFAVQAADLQSATIEIPIVVTGQAVDFERKVQVEIDQELSTAAQGTDYSVLPVVIPANAFRTFLKVQVNRTPAIAEKERYVTFRIAASEGLGIDVNPNWIDYKLKINDILTKPARWIYDCQPYFGVYSMVKYRFIIDTLGIWNFPSTGENAIPKAQMLFYQDKMKSALAKWEKENGKLMMDEKGNKITF